MKSTLVPKNLDMSLFGGKGDKIALVLDRMYRAKMYRNAYGYDRRKKDFTEPVALNMKCLVEMLGEPATPVLDMICRSKRHAQNKTQPIVEVLDRVKRAKKGVRSALYKLAEPYRVQPRIHRLRRINNPVFKYDKAAMDKVIADYPDNYRRVCGHIKTLTLEIDEAQCEELIQRIRDKYIQKDREEYIGDKIFKLMAQYPKMNEGTANARATASWERCSQKRIARLDDEHYDSLLFIRDKVLEMEGKTEMPIYSIDEQGRLHYYLTNLSEVLRPYILLNGCKMVSYDLGTSQCVFVWVTLREYIRENNLTLDGIKRQADEIMETIRQCNDGAIPDYVCEGFSTLKRKRRPQTLDDEMKQLGKLLGKDFYADIMQTIGWQFGRKRFKTEVLFPFLYGKKPSWNPKTERKTMMHYFVQKFPAVYCVLWKMRRFTEICFEFNRRIAHKEHPLKVLEYIAETYGTAEFPKEMQRREADMFFNVIIPQIDQPLVTIHDSIVVQAGKRCNVSKIIKQAFWDKYQIRVRVSCENWYNP